MRVLFLFVDGVGLGKDDNKYNPFSTAVTPTINSLLSGKKLVVSTIPFRSSNCVLLGLDAQMGVPGLPQSATNQASLFTGINFAKRLGYHYGPKPNNEITSYFSETQNPSDLNTGNPSPNDPKYISLISFLETIGWKTGLLNAYPHTYFEQISSKRRNHAVIPLAFNSAGIGLLNQDDLFQGRALSADFTGQGWHDHLGLPQTPIITPFRAGEILTSLSMNYDFSLFDYWESDYAGHKQDLGKAIRVIEKLDRVIEGLITTWDFENGVVLITSDHGNLEDLSTRKHTLNQVPALLIGNPKYQDRFIQKVKSIEDITPFFVDIISDKVSAK